MTKQNGIAKHAAGKPNAEDTKSAEQARKETAERKTVSEAAADKEPPATTEQPGEANREEPVRDENPIGLPPMPAHLEGQDDVKTPVKIELMPAYEQGRAAFTGGIGKDDAPYGEGTALDAWRKGWAFAKKAAG